MTWGLAEFIAAEEFGRYRGFWWAPDGKSLLATRVDDSRVPRWHLHDPAAPEREPRTIAYPHAGTPNAEVTLHLLDLDGGWVDVHWDREIYPYLASVRWSERGGPLITVLRRLQQHGLVLAVDPRTGETQVHAELADPRWVEPIPGTPTHLPDGRVLVGGELVHDGYDARCLFADGTLLTPPGAVRAPGVRLPVSAAADLLVEASEGEPAEQHLYRVVHGGGAAQLEVRRITRTPVGTSATWAATRWSSGGPAWTTPGTVWTVYRRRRGGPAALARRPTAVRAAPGAGAGHRPSAADGRGLPGAHVTGGGCRCCVDIYGGPMHQEVVAARRRGWSGSGGPTPGSRSSSSTTGVRPAWRRPSRR